MMIPITPSPREAVLDLQDGERRHRRAFGAPIPLPSPPSDPIGTIAVKDLALQRPVPVADSAKFEAGSSPLFKRDNSNQFTNTTSDSIESAKLFNTTTLVSNNTVSFFDPSNQTAHINSPAMNGSSFKASSGTYASLRRPNPSESDLAMKTLFDEYVVSDFEEDHSLLFTPYTNATSFTHSTLTSVIDTPSISLAEIDSFLNTTSLGTQDFNLFTDQNGLSTEELDKNPLFNPGSLAEDPIAPYALFKDTSATVTSASPQKFSFSSPRGVTPATSVATKPEPLPSPELSPSAPRKTNARRNTVARAATRRVSAAPFTPITPAPTTPSTPQAVISRATKRRIPVYDEDPAVIEKRRRNTIAAQRSRARKAEERADDKTRITQLEKETEALRVLLSYWKDRACGLGASPLEDGEN